MLVKNHGLACGICMFSSRSFRPHYTKGAKSGEYGKWHKTLQPKSNSFENSLREYQVELLSKKHKRGSGVSVQNWLSNHTAVDTKTLL